MPVYDQSYKRWQGQLQNRWFRIWVIFKTAAKRPFVKKWVMFILLMVILAAQAWPFMGLVVVWGLENMDQYAGVEDFVQDMARSLKMDLRVNGTMVYIFTVFYPLFFAFLISLGVGANLISSDKKHHALPLYFSRGISPWDYLMGKFSGVGIFILVLTGLPVVMITFGHIIIASDWLYFFNEPRVLLGAITVPLLITVTYGLLILACSSMSRSGWFAGFIFVGIVGILPGVARVMYQINKNPWTQLLSVSGNLKRVAGAIYGYTPPDIEAIRSPLWQAPTWASFVILGVIIAGCLLILKRNLKPVEVVK